MLCFTTTCLTHGPVQADPSLLKEKDICCFQFTLKSTGLDHTVCYVQVFMYITESYISTLIDYILWANTGVTTLLGKRLNLYLILAIE